MHEYKTASVARVGGIIFAVLTKDQSSNCSRNKKNRRFPAKDAEVAATFAALFSRDVFAATLFTAVGLLFPG